MVFFQQGQEHFGSEHTLLGMPPTDQSFCTNNTLVAEPNFGLQVNLEVPIF